jgi:hypothetical protein
MPYRRAGEDCVRKWDMPDPRTPVLILSDLGMPEGASDVKEAWRQFAACCGR